MAFVWLICIYVSDLLIMANYMFIYSNKTPFLTEVISWVMWLWYNSPFLNQGFFQVRKHGCSAHSAECLSIEIKFRKVAPFCSLSWRNPLQPVVPTKDLTVGSRISVILLSHHRMLGPISKVWLIWITTLWIKSLPLLFSSMCCMLANTVALVTLFNHSICYGHSGKSLPSVSSHITAVVFDNSGSGIVTLEDAVSTQIMTTST